MIWSGVVVTVLNWVLGIIQFFIPFDIISAYVTVNTILLGFMPTITSVISKVLYFFPANYLFPLVIFMACIMMLRLGISIFKVVMSFKFI